MNTIKNLLNEYLCHDAIIIRALSEKASDHVWLEEQGYYDRKTGNETKEGKTYTKYHNKLVEDHFGKITDNSFDSDNLYELTEAIKNCIRENPSMDIYEGMTETEIFAFRYIYYHHY